MKPIAVVSGIIENEKGEILLAQRPPGKRLAGFWEFPGGKIEAGESGEAALLRELKEELNLDVRIVNFLGVFRHNYEWGTIDLHVYVVSALSAPSATEDVHIFKWIRPSKIERAELAEADVEPLEFYLTSRPKTE